MWVGGRTRQRKEERKRGKEGVKERVRGGRKRGRVREKVGVGAGARIELKKGKISTNLLQARQGYNKFLV